MFSTAIYLLRVWLWVKGIARSHWQGIPSILREYCLYIDDVLKAVKMYIMQNAGYWLLTSKCRPPWKKWNTVENDYNKNRIFFRYVKISLHYTTLSFNNHKNLKEKKKKKWNTVEKEENADNHHFPLFPQCFFFSHPRHSTTSTKSSLDKSVIVSHVKFKKKKRYNNVKVTLPVL